MPFLIFFMLLLLCLGLIWIIAAGLLMGTLVSRIPNVLDRVLDYKGRGYCACHFPFQHHT